MWCWRTIRPRWCWWPIRFQGRISGTRSIKQLPLCRLVELGHEALFLLWHGSDCLSGSALMLGRQLASLLTAEEGGTDNFSLSQPIGFYGGRGLGAIYVPERKDKEGASPRFGSRGLTEGEKFSVQFKAL
jgi:hypothetical protein